MASLLSVFLLLSSLLVPFSAVAQTNGNITVGSNISAAINSSSWVSASGDFAFGFQQLGRGDHFLLSIWYAKIPEKTIVWYGNEGQPALSGSKIALTSDRGLVLSDPNGKEIWNSDSVIGSVSHAVMNDTGNFMLKSSDSEVLWESFKNPTDTILPGQILERKSVVSCRLRETDFSTGRFQLRLLEDGNLVLNSINLPTTSANEAYYISGTFDQSNSSNSGYQVVFNESGYMYILRANDQIFSLTSGEKGSAEDFYYRATLNFDGIFTKYGRQRNSNGSWSALWSIPENICSNNTVKEASGVCGYNSVCRLGSDKRPICQCPRGYSLLDPNDPYGSCKPDFELSCEEDGLNSTEKLYEFANLTSVDWPLSDYVKLTPYTSEQCQESCLQDCMCAVAIFGDNSCWKKRLPLSNGRTGTGRLAFLKIRKGGATSPNTLNPVLVEKGKNQDTLIVTGSVLLGGSLFLNFILVCLAYFFIYDKKRQKTQQAGGGTLMETNLHCFTYEELVKATDGFKEELGRGAFGIVYKGKIQTGGLNNLVAIKKLDRLSETRDKEFRTEVKVIGQTHHKNLVRLLGFCDEGPNRLLVYELLPNGTLASFLFGNSRPSWNQRMHIAVGIARGLAYLHEECSTQIIHCDIKPQNILLDEYYNARIADFGLAKLLMLNQSQTNTGIRGTKGYVAAEWFRNMPITVKVDVYSFGVMLLEIVSCRKSVDLEISVAEKAILTDWAYDCYREGTLGALVNDDPEALNDMGKVERFVMVALWCIQEDPSLRPTMRNVTRMLEGVVEVNIPPPPFPFNISTSA